MNWVRSIFNNYYNWMKDFKLALFFIKTGFDPFTETQKALEELIKDEVNRKKTENGELASKRNALNAPPGFSQPSPRNLSEL